MDKKLFSIIFSFIISQAALAQQQAVAVLTSEKEIVEELKITESGDGNSLQIFSGQKVENVKVADLTGETILKKSPEYTGRVYKLDTRELNPGIYILTITQGDKETTRRFIVP